MLNYLHKVKANNLEEKKLSFVGFLKVTNEKEQESDPDPDPDPEADPEPDP